MSYSKTKRKTNLDKHGIDLALCEQIFDAPMLTREDGRIAYGEQRLQSLCWLNGRVVVVVWVDRVTGAHFISCRESEKHETQRYFQAFL